MKGMFNDMQIRELTGKEKRSIRNLIKTMCANYDDGYGCLLLGSSCFMFGKAHTDGALCKWFRNALMPLDTELARIFTGGVMPDTKPCTVCGKAFPLNGRQAYCSETCAKTGRRKSVADSVKVHRERQRRNVIN